MAIYDFFLSRNGAAATPANYVGHVGRLFYDSATGEIRISDGATAGGLPIAITLATETTSGGVKLGPGVTTNAQGQIIIDSEGLDFSFGDFEAITDFYSDSTAYALLSSANVDEDIVIASNGTGDIKVVGGFEVYATDGSVTASLEDAEPFFKIKADGQVRVLVPLADTTEGGMEIIGSDLGTALEPGQAGTMLHLTGNADLPTRVYHDTLGDYGSYVFRRYNGSVITPTQVLANEDIARLNWTAATNAGMGSMATAQIRITVLENQTTTAQGSKIVFTVTPVGSPASARVDVATISTADGVSATKFTGPLTGNVTGNVSGTAPAGSLTGNTLASNVVTSSLTTVGTLTNLSVTNTITGSVSGNAGTVTNGVYTTDTATVTNTMLAGSIANNKLSNSTISGVALGSNLAALTIDGYLIGTSYNGSTGVTISVDATTAATASKVVARDANAVIAGANFQGTVRNLGTVSAGAGDEITINFATDHIVRCNYSTETIDVGFTNYTAGKTVTLIATNTSGVNRVLDIGIAAANTQGDTTLDVNNGTTIIVTYYCTGTTVDDVFASTVYTI